MIIRREVFGCAAVLSAVAIVLVFGLDAPPAAAATKERTVADMLDGLAIDVQEEGADLSLTVWGYACAGQASCAAGCVDTLNALAEGRFDPDEKRAFCPAFKKEGALAPDADRSAKRAAALAWMKKRVQAVAAAARRGADADDRDRIDCRLAELHLAGDAKTCLRADALTAAATLSKMAEEPNAERSDALWTAFCAELESCAGSCSKLLYLLPRIAPEAASRLPLCSDVKTALGSEKVGSASLTRFGRQRAAAFVTRAAGALDPARGKSMRCHAARVRLLPPEPACER
jgi:hypothetical protein